jgi:hypothetical protein
MTITRRAALLALVSTALCACTQIKGRATPPPAPARPAEFGRWTNEALAMLSDGLETLQTFETFAAFRVSSAKSSDRRSATDLAWDPPTNAQWVEATHVARGLHGRAEQLLGNVSTARIDVGLWRDQRDVADATSGLLDLGDALNAYRDRVSRLGPAGDATDTWDLLDRAWALWDTSASKWELSRARSVPC